MLVGVRLTIVREVVLKAPTELIALCADGVIIVEAIFRTVVVV